MKKTALAFAASLLLTVPLLAQSQPVLISCGIQQPIAVEGYVVQNYYSKSILVDSYFGRFLNIAVQIPGRSVQHLAILMSRAGNGAISGNVYASGVGIPDPAATTDANTLAFKTDKVSGRIVCEPSQSAYGFVPMDSDQDSRDPAFSASRGALTAEADSIFDALNTHYCVAGSVVSALVALQRLPTAAAHKPQLVLGGIEFSRDAQVGCDRYSTANRDASDICDAPVYGRETVSLKSCAR